MEHKEMVTFLQRKVKVIGGISLLTLASVVIVQLARSLESAQNNEIWGLVATIFIFSSFAIALLLFGHVVHLIYKIFKKA